MITRHFYSGDIPCFANCSYCFAKWKTYNPPQKAYFLGDPKSTSVVYPCCDSDISQNAKIISDLWSIAKNSKEIFFSVSVKRSIDNDVLDLYKELDKYLQAEKKGFVKISISLTTKYRIDELEPNTMSYEERKKLFVHLHSIGFHTAVVFKPILPFIPLDEYREIIDEFSICKFYLLGDLYVNEETDFYKKYIEGQYGVKSRSVSWLEDRPLWYHVDQEERINLIEAYLKNKHKNVFYSDVDLIDYMSKCDTE